MAIKLSVVIITFNEEANIGRCIEATLLIADEIIVLDSFSADKTEEICRSYNVVFQQHKFDGHIEQKNRALSLTSNKYVLALDADEVLSNELCESIAKIKNNWQVDGYYFNRLTNYCGKWIKHGGWYPDQKLRLWNKEKGQWGGTNPHDKVVMTSGSKTEHIKGDLLHYSYNSINQHINQGNNFTQILSRELFVSGKKSSTPKIIYKSVWKFIKDYFICLGFLDGYYGFIVASISAFFTFTKYAKLKQLWINNEKNNN